MPELHGGLPGEGVAFVGPECMLRFDENERQAMDAISYEGFCMPMKQSPRRYVYHGKRYGIFDRPRTTTDPYDEGNLVSQIVASGYRIAAWYSLLMPDYYRAAPPNSGLLLCTAVPSDQIMSTLKNPGDIDILAIPYEGTELVLSKTLTIEVKIIRASYSRQGKSPNQFGFSQAESLIKHGFPYVAVAHLIIFDAGPESTYREIIQCQYEDGKLTDPHPIMDDPLPAVLTERARGRLISNCSDRRIGCFAYYLHPDKLYFQEGKKSCYAGYSYPVLKAIAQYYYLNSEIFLQMPRYDEGNDGA